MKLAVAQFEPRDGDKVSNLHIIEELCQKAATEGADTICFHEMCVTAYTFTKDLDRTAILDLAEEVPSGSSSLKLIEIAKAYNITILAGLIEKAENKIFNTYICVNRQGLIAKFRKLHPFISTYLSPGNRYVTFELNGWTCGILICYDNNVIENVRATALLGAEIIFAPHVTGCTPSAMPGRGYVDDQLWQDRKQNPAALRKEFDGPKGREWLLRWLPARAYDNGVYYAFSNPIGYDGLHLKNGNAMIIDPYGEVLTETKSFGAEIAMVEITKDKLTLAGGARYKKARRPELYREIIGAEHDSVTKPTWMK